MLKNLNKIKPQSPKSVYGNSAISSRKKLNRVKILNPEKQPIISCRNDEFNLYLNQIKQNNNGKLGSIALASNGWKSRQSKGDFFAINPTIQPDIVHNKQQSIAQLQHDHNINALVIENMKELQINQLTEIQSTAIPKILNKNHVMIAAETGCGKTLSYLIPIITKVLEMRKKQKPNDRKQLNQPLALILTPGRELATQIGTIAVQLGKETDLKVKTIIGGNTKQKMLNPNVGEVDILIGSIGAISKLITTGIYKTNHVHFVVLDEADTLLDDSFSNKLGYVLKRFPFFRNFETDPANNGKKSVKCQLILATATMPNNIENQLGNIIDTETIQGVISTNLHRILPHVEHRFLRMNKSDRPGQLFAIIKDELQKKRPLIIFGNQSRTSDFISIFLNDAGVNCLNLNGDMLSKIRYGRFERFQSGSVNVLSTTDVCSRGLDTTRARHVINFDFPLHLADYIHRCGRIGRLGSIDNCMVTNFISSQREINAVQTIEHAARTGGFLPGVNANITNIIQNRIIKDRGGDGDIK